MSLFILVDNSVDGGQQQPAERLNYVSARPKVPKSDHLPPQNEDPPRYKDIQLHDPTDRQPPRPIQPFSAPQPPRY